jgi:5-methylcytosine-specific restriction endonuclease McrA
LKQQERAKSRKQKLIELLGGKCSVCGYSKNYAALEFHHTNPIEKDGNLDSRKLSNSTWGWCLEESKKCILLCSNCHAEHHHPHLNCQ